MTALRRKEAPLLRAALASLLVAISTATRAGGLWLPVGEPVALGGGVFETPLEFARYDAAVGAYKISLTYDPAVLRIISVSVPVNSPFTGNTFFNQGTFSTGATAITAFQTQPPDNLNSPVRVALIQWQARTGQWNLQANIVARVNTLVDAGWRPVDVETYAIAYVDTDGDGIPDSADSDDDNDGLPDAQDAFPADPTESVDTDHDGIGDNADTDDDGDGVPDSADNCPMIANPDQNDQNGDGIGDLCAPTSEFCWACLPNSGGWRAILR